MSTTPDPARSSVELVGTMGWIDLPYDTVGLVRNTEVNGNRLWSYLILIPWAINDSKPWIDGVELVERPTMTEDLQRELVLSKMREILDSRYADSGRATAADEFLRSLEGE